MSDVIFLIQENGDNLTLSKMSNKSYITEDQMQKLIADFPEMLPGDQINSANPRRWLLIGREIGIPAQEGAGDNWSIDVVLVDQDATLTLVEVKLGTNYEIRRKITGQLLEYAAHAIDNWKLETLITCFNKTWEKKDPANILTTFLGEEDDPDKFWEQVESNLRAGKIRLIFVADKLPDALKRVIKFLNRQMSQAEVYGVEIPQFGTEQGGSRTIVSRVTGQLERPVSPVLRATWDEPALFKRLQDTSGHEIVKIAATILDWAKDTTDRISWGSGTANGSFSPKVKSQGIDRQLFSLTTEEGGRVQFYFTGGSFYDNMPPFNTEPKRIELVSRLNNLLKEPVPAAKTRKSMWLSLFIFQDETKLAEFFQIMEWVIGEVNNPS